MVDEARLTFHRDDDGEVGDYVLYWMQSSVRAEWNPALEYAIGEANRLGKRLLVCFGLTADYPEANLRQYRFVVEGLSGVAPALSRRNIKFVVRQGHPPDVAAELARDAAAVVMDRGYLRHLRAWRRDLVDAVSCPVTEVEGDVVVPVETASDKREYAARTIRPKIHQHLDRFLTEQRTVTLDKHSLNLSVDGIDVDDVDEVLDRIDVDDAVSPGSRDFVGGTSQAKARLRRFLSEEFRDYDDKRNQPQTDAVSYMSMYLHYGHISPVYVALQAKGSGAPNDQLDSFIEELVVRRELTFNYVWFEPDYDKYSALPEWARKTLDKHRDDERENVYTREELESGATHDPYWNAAMAELRETGYMHNYMRMYWGKKILEWTNTPEYGFRTTLYLNNKYFYDGRDPNSYANVGWVYGLHDRPWQERDVFGTVRYMSAGGLERKGDPEAYVRKVEDFIGHSLSDEE